MSYARPPGLSASSPVSADFYVATDGDDGWSGTLAAPNDAGTDGPFATLNQAREAVRQLRAGQHRLTPITVMVRGGTYYLSEAVVFTAEDSGTADAPVTYAAYPGEQPVLSGARPLTNWQQYRGEILQCDLPEVRDGNWRFRQLFFDGRPQIRARFPNYEPNNPLYGGWAFIEEPISETAFRYAAGTFPRHWAKANQGEIFIFPGKCWDNDIIPIKDVDPDRRIITLQRPPYYHTFLPLTAGNRFYVANLLEELDQPGEWCLDSETGTLYFWPPSGSLCSGQVTAPVARRLIELRGTEAAPIRHINIIGFTFTQTLSLFPQARQHPPSDRAGDDPVQTFNLPQSGGQAVYLENAEHCCIQDNYFQAVGGDAVRLQDYTAYNRVVGNTIAKAGGHGICLASTRGDDPPPSWQTDPGLLSKLVSGRPRSVRNMISGNHIHHCGRIEKHGMGIYLYGINSVDNVISHNLIHHTPRMGIGLMHGFGRSFIEYNELHDMGLETCDVGALMIDRWFTYEPDDELSQGHVIRFNLARDVVGCGAYKERLMPGGGTTAGGKIYTPYFSWGIYLDTSSKNTIVYGNIVIGNVLGGIMMLGDVCDNLIENNILSNSSYSQITYGSMSAAASGNRVVRNIVYYTDPDALLINIGTQPHPHALAEADYNLFFPASGQTPTVNLPDVDPEDSFARWQQLGYDNHSLIADPLFVDPDSGDYRLQSGSPALKLGFRPIQFDKIGLPPTAANSPSQDEMIL